MPVSRRARLATGSSSTSPPDGSRRPNNRPLSTPSDLSSVLALGHPTVPNPAPSLGTATGHMWRASWNADTSHAGPIPDLRTSTSGQSVRDPQRRRVVEQHNKRQRLRKESIRAEMQRIGLVVLTSHVPACKARLADGRLSVDRRSGPRRGQDADGPGTVVDQHGPYLDDPATNPPRKYEWAARMPSPTIQRNGTGMTAWTKKQQKEIDQAKHVLAGDEQILDVTTGMGTVKRMGSETSRNGGLIVTDRRIIFFTKKLGGYEMSDHTYATLTALD